MHYIADLHIHSYYSRATSKMLNLEHIHKWSQLKGLTVIGTGDITHPKWLEEMQEKLEPTEEGLFRLKPEFAKQIQAEVPKACQAPVYFILSGEISSIYKRDEAVRKIHNVVFLPSFEAVQRFQTTLDRIGNIHSDGRPILGLDSRDLLEIVLETDPQAHLIPAHIWTPWFSMLGSKSGFDSVEACFGDLTRHIFAVETGLSSDPPMNWRLSMLDPYTLVSNSDAHSPEKLAREANIFDTELSYPGIFAALKEKDSDAFWGTIEFFPEEGKYHMDGHRKCAQMLRPAETIAKDGLCPVCGKPVTVGVSHRVEVLADRPEGTKPEGVKPFMSLVPLPEVLAEVHKVGAKSKRVQDHFHSMLRELGSEMHILMDCSLKDIQKAAGSLVAEGIRRMREGEVYFEPGYDGEYGIVRLFKPGEREQVSQQGALFTLDIMDTQSSKIVDKPAPEQRAVPSEMAETTEAQPSVVRDSSGGRYGLNTEQRQAVMHRGSPLIIHAGPGTGKTRTLTHRLAGLIESGEAKPTEILAITFTNKAAEEMRERLQKLLGEEVSTTMRIQTFHAFGANLLRDTPSFFGRTQYFVIFDPSQETSLLQAIAQKTGHRFTKALLDRISRTKGELLYPEHLRSNESSEPAHPQDWDDPIFGEVYQAYEAMLSERNAVDYDDLIGLPVRLLRADPEKRRKVIQQFPVIAVDEFQDINLAQYEFFRILALSAREVCVIGDPDQAIYGFRGARSEFFLRFAKDFPNTAILHLKQNYRSAQNILAASRQMLTRSHEEESDNLWSNIAPDVKVHFHHTPTDRAEAEFVVHRIEQWVGGTSYFSIDSKRVDDDGLPRDYTFSDFAVLVRTKKLAAPLTEALARSGIPFESLTEETIASEELVRFMAMALRLVQRSTVYDTLIKDDMSDHVREGLRKLRLSQNELAQTTDISAARLIEQIWEVADLNQWPGLTDSPRQRQRFIHLAKPFGERIDAFVDALMLQREVDDFDERAERVHVMTLHAAKGLEFPVVFVIGCEEGILPFARGGEISDVEEERRLLYVGMTRAERHLVLTHTKKRFWNGKIREQKPSRFLNAISDALIQRERLAPRKAKKDESQLKLF